MRQLSLGEKQSEEITSMTEEGKRTNRPESGKLLTPPTILPQEELFADKGLMEIYQDGRKIDVTERVKFDQTGQGCDQTGMSEREPSLNQGQPTGESTDKIQEVWPRIGSDKVPEHLPKEIASDAMKMKPIDSPSTECIMRKENWQDVSKYPECVSAEMTSVLPQGGQDEMQG